MKNIFFGLLLIFLWSACEKPTEKMNASLDVKDTLKVSSSKNEISIDSVFIEGSMKNNKYVSSYYKAKVLAFSGIQNQRLLDSIYAPLGILLNAYSKENLISELKKKKQEYFQSNSKEVLDYSPDWEQLWDSISDMNVRSYQNKRLTLSYSFSGNAGGAHGYYNILYKNFDLLANKSIALEDIFKDKNKINWPMILDKHFRQEEQREMLLVEEIPVNQNFYFDDKAIVFIYNAYEITAYAAGIVEIKIPFHEVKSHLKPEFKARFGIK